MPKNQDKFAFTPEWSHKVDGVNLPDGQVPVSITASPQERADLARRFKVKSIDALWADLTLQRSGIGNVIYVSGHVKGTITQPCVVTAADLKQEIDEHFEAWYADKEAVVSLNRVRHDRLSKALDAEVPMLEESEDPEPMVDGQIDLGELAAQYASLAIDPYPRAEGVEASAVLEEKGLAEQSRNPFAALKKWKAERGGSGTH